MITFDTPVSTDGRVERHRKASARWREKYPEKVKARNATAREKLLNESPETILLYSARARAKQQGVPCTITLEDIHIPDVCPVFGIPFARGDMKWTASLDKVIPEIGYVPGNVQVISRFANTVKSDASPSELVAFARWVLRRESNDSV